MMPHRAREATEARAGPAPETAGARTRRAPVKQKIVSVSAQIAWTLTAFGPFGPGSES